MWNNHIQNW